MKTVLRLLKFMQPIVGWIALSMLLSVLAIGANIGLLGTSAYLIAQAALHPSIAELQVAIVGVRFFGISRSLLRYLERLASHSVNFRLLAGMRVWFFQALEPLAPARMIDSRSGDLLNRIIADVDNLEDFFVRAVSPPLTALLVTLGMGMFLGSSYLVLGVILVGGLIFNGIVVPMLVRWLNQRPGMDLVTSRAQLSAEMVDGLQGIAELWANGRSADYRHRLSTADAQLSRAQVRIGMGGGLASAANGLASQLTLWMVLLAAIPLVHDGQMGGVTLAVVSLLVLASFEATLPLGGAAQKLDSALQSGNRLFEIADLSPAVSEPASPVAPPRSSDLQIRDLTFTYSNDRPPVLSGFSLDLPAGKRVGVIGPSGAGKTTLAKILLRFWDYGEGHILLAGHELREYNSNQVREIITVIEQTPYLFNATIRDNLLLARPGATDQQLEQVLRQASLWNWVERLPASLDTWVGEHGAQMSGGERQRLAVARALLVNAPIWLLDEPGEHLDPANRSAVVNELLDVTRGRSVIWITHEIRELAQMDEVIVMREGEIVERGEPARLEHSGGWYAHWKGHQFIG